MVAGQEPQVEKLLRILIDSLTDSVGSINEKPQRFMRLLGLAYTQAQEHLRSYLAHSYGSTYNRFIGWLKKTQPNLDPIVFYWRLNFILGAAIFTFGSFDSIRAILHDEQKVDTEMNQVLDYLIDGLSGLLSSPNNQHVG